MKIRIIPNVTDTNHLVGGVIFSWLSWMCVIVFITPKQWVSCPMAFHHRTILRVLSVSNGRKLPRCSLIFTRMERWLEFAIIRTLEYQKMGRSSFPTIIFDDRCFLYVLYSPSSKRFDNPYFQHLLKSQHLGLDGARIPTDFATVPPSHHVKRLPSGTRRFSSTRGWPFRRCLRMWSASVLWWAPWGSLGSGRLGTSEKENVDGVD